MAPSDDKAKQLSEGLLQALDDLSGGVHPGFRPAHAKGIMLSGKFTPAPGATSLTRAPHVQRVSTPVTVRFSDSGGIPTVPDNDPKDASPRGIAVRFHLAEHVHTDIIGVSTDGFPVHKPEEFLELLQAVHASGPGAAHPTAIEMFLATHPKALKFVMTPKPIPTSFARENFFSVNAFRFTAAAGSSRFGRYRIRPDEGAEHLDEAAAAAKGPDFLFDELRERIAAGHAVKFQVAVQLANEGDTVDDATVNWPEDRQQMDFGSIELTAVAPEDVEHRKMIFDPIPRVEGIDPSGDPLLGARADLYLMSGRRRRKDSGL